MSAFTMPPRIWADTEPTALPPHPAPEVPCRDAETQEIPRSAQSMALLAYKHGWSVRTTYARGTKMLATGKPGNVVDSIAVRLQRPGWRVAAIWIDGKFSCALSANMMRWSSPQLRAMVTLFPLRETPARPPRKKKASA